MARKASVRAQVPRPKHSKPTPLSAEALMGNKRYMLKWLRSKTPRAVVAVSMMDSDACLGAMFLRENGFPNAYWYCTLGRAESGEPTIDASPSIGRALEKLCDSKHSRNLTAAQAIRALENA